MILGSKIHDDVGKDTSSFCSECGFEFCLEQYSQIPVGDSHEIRERLMEQNRKPPKDEN
jgi:hypothetical protein